MYLTINSSNNFFELKGVLNKTNVEGFERKIIEALDSFGVLTINIENLNSIDRAGVKAFSNLYAQSIKDEKQLSIIGMGCKELYDHFKTQIPKGNAA